MGCRVALLVWLYLSWAWFSYLVSLWSRFYETDWECDAPALPPNRSGVKVLVAGLAKTGTRTMSRALFQLGLEHSYHSEDFGLFLWGRYADRYWLDKSGGRWSGTPIPGFLNNFNLNDYEVLQNTSPEELAAATSRCRVDAIAFDGIEKLFLPMYAVSPGAKVIMLNWRSFAAWQQSIAAFAPLLMLEIFLMMSIHSSMSVLPWSAVLQLVDPLAGRRLERTMRAGGPPICQVYDWYISLFHGAVNFRRIASQWFSGNQLYPETEDEYESYFKSIKDMVPSENLLEWNMVQHSFEDLCRFLEIANCTQNGRLPRAVNSFLFQRDFPAASAVTIPISLVCHWINVMIFKFILRRLARFVTPKLKNG